jgi:uncharacterized protein YydD (DUF2326 family)
MAKKPKSITDIDQQIETLKAQRVAVLETRAAHIGKIAAKADLTTLEISDATLLREFQQIADRFRRKSAPGSPQST